jgi:succinyl-diaminopimelate desuccinylase
VMIGYPGLDHVVTGGRGVLRACVHVHGVAGIPGRPGPAPVPSPRPHTQSASLTRCHCPARPDSSSRCQLS